MRSSFDRCFQLCLILDFFIFVSSVCCCKLHMFSFCRVWVDFMILMFLIFPLTLLIAFECHFWSPLSLFPYCFIRLLIFYRLFIHISLFLILINCHSGSFIGVTFSPFHVCICLCVFSVVLVLENLVGVIIYFFGF